MVKTSVVSICVGSLVLPLGLSPFAFSQESTLTEEAASAVETPDYGKAIEMLLKLGFADTKGTSYKTIKSPTLDNSRSSVSFSSSSDRTAPPVLKGNGWLTAGSPQKIILLNGTSQDYKETDKPGYAQSNEPLQGKSSDANVLEDMKEAKKWLLESSGPFTERHYWSYGGKPIFNQYFVLACQAYRAGHKKEANELIATLFRLAPNQESLLDGVISEIANRKLEETTLRFTQSKDWKTYQQELTSLKTTYSRGWPTRYALAMLIPQVEKRANGVPAPMPAINGVTFSQQAQDLLRKTAQDGQKLSINLRSSYYYSDDSASPVWLLNPKKEIDTSEPPFQQLTQLGMDGFIALTALIGDDTLVIIDQGRTSYYGGSYSYRYSNYSDNSDMEIAASIYATMNRPKTRGEIALAYVRTCLPDASSDSHFSSSDNLTADEIKAMAIDFWKEHKDDSELELVKYYLGSNNLQIVAGVANSLISQNTDESIALFESTILESASPSLYSSQVKSYVLKRRQKAKDFLEKYKTVLVKELGPGKLEDYDNNGQYQIMQDGGAEKFIEKLMSFTENLKPSQLLVRLSRPDADTKGILEQLEVALEDKPLGKLRSKFVYAAAKSDDDKAAKIIEFLYYLDSESFSSEKIEDGAQRKAGFDPPLSKFETEDWLNLLARTERRTSEEYGQNISIADMVGVLLESIANPDYDEEYYYKLYKILGADDTFKLYKQRSTARLNGKELTPLPSAEEVPAERKQELIKSIKESKPAELLHTIDKMTVSEHLMFATYLENNEQPESYLATKDYITAIDASRLPVSEESKKAEARIKSLLYAQKLDIDTIKALLPKLSEHHAELAGTTLTIGRQRGKPGFVTYLVSSSYLKTSESLLDADKGIRDKKYDHYVSLLLNPRRDEESNIMMHNASEISKEHTAQIVSALEDLEQGYFNAAFTIENSASIAATDKQRDANKDEREALIKILNEKTNGAFDEEAVKQLSLEQLKAILEQIEDIDF